jgi:hypothetical protein
MIKELRFLIILLLPVFTHCSHKQTADQIALSRFAYLGGIRGGDTDSNRVIYDVYFMTGSNIVNLPEGYEIFLDTSRVTLEYSKKFLRNLCSFPEKDFVGPHTWIIKKGNRNVVEVPFTYSTFEITPPPAPAVVYDSDVRIPVSGLPDGTEMQCHLQVQPDSDHAYSSQFLLYKIHNGAITILNEDFGRLPPALYHVSIRYHQDLPIKVDGLRIDYFSVSHSSETFDIIKR